MGQRSSAAKTADTGLIGDGVEGEAQDHRHSIDHHSVPSGSSQSSVKFNTMLDIQCSASYAEDEEHPLECAQRIIQQISESSSILDDAFHFRFDIFEFNKLTDRPLLVLGVYLLSHCPKLRSLFEGDKVSLKHCATFMDICERLYQNVPYHNSTHAADVMQFNTIMLSKTAFSRHNLTDYEVLAGVMCAVVHDVGHIGRNNDYLIKSNHELARRFKKVSILEQYHIEQLHSILAVPSANWMQHFEVDEQQHMISMMEYAVLGTDMGLYHGPIRKALSEHYTAQWAVESFSRSLSVDERKFMIRAMLHLSDISNPMRPFQIGWEWANRVNQEFFAQGDEMKAMQLELTSNCDRSKTNVISNQSNFIEHCMRPLAQLMARVIGELEEVLDNIPVNLTKLKEIKERQSTEDQSKEFVMVKEIKPTDVGIL